ncbi:hypothetical protein ABIC28_004963 [Rhodococcus sp. PvR044]|jgi:hypothetical protein|nr:hypothetical protein [Rhodococcus maanshanensis]MBP1160436.1 hypothetical protein [Rhodococcus sp. PvR099]MCZ4556171.1 hypothetical protein [Rhodococcus maanshanensis]PTR36864.1 hypothetical protein C8K38_12227 [Rhodococcus sp. OK611]SNX93595.1 hypothetical protein SAMN05447004_12228 [Rhodococcus sp. OK270]
MRAEMLVPADPASASGSATDGRPARAPRWWQLCGRRVMQIALALIALQLVVRGLVLSRGYFYWDDLILTGRSGSMSLLSSQFLFYDHDGHFMPAAFLVAGIATRLAPYNWPVAALMLLVLQALASLAVLRLLRLILGRRPAILIPLVFYLFSPLTLPAFAWWAAGLNALPLQIGLAWVAGDAIRLCRTGSARYAISGFLVFAVSLQFFEKAVLVPLVAFAAVALIYRVDGRAQPIRAATARGALLWAPTLLLAVVWSLIYRLTVTVDFAEYDGASAVEMVKHATSKGLLPTLFGGPWTWDRWPPSPPWAEPPGVLIAASGVLAAAVVVATIVWKRRVAWVWIAVGAYVFASVAAMVVTRSGAETTFELGQTLRYLTDSAVIIAIALAVILRAPARTAGAGSVRGPAVAVALMSAFVAGSLVSTATFADSWRDDTTRDYLANARSALAAHPDVPLLEQPASIWVLLPVAHPHNLVSHVLGPLPDRPEFAASTPELRMLDDDGRLVDAQVTWVRAIDPGPEPGCGHRIGTDVSELPLDGPLAGWEWTVRLNYLASADGEITVSLQQGEPVTVPVRRGANSVFVRLTGGGGLLEVRAVEPDLTLCVGSGPVGVVVPSP